MHLTLTGALLTAPRPPLPLSMSTAKNFVERTTGEWAGWQCEFSAAGVLKPVDERFLSQETIDYGMQPAGFELLATETSVGGDLRRRFMRILPAEGCACDNLSAEVSASCISRDILEGRVRGDTGLGVFTLDDPPGDGGDDWYLRTCFEMAAPPSATVNGAAQGVAWRTRLSLRWDPAGKLALGKRLVMAVERRWATEAGVLDGELNQGGASLIAGRSGATGCDAR